MKTKQKINPQPSLVNINRFDSQRDNRVKHIAAVEWSTLSDFFLGEPIVTTDKEAVALFNVAQYKPISDINDPDLIVQTADGNSVPRRKQLNVAWLDALVLDFDGGMSIEQAKVRFKDYTYIAYTSHSHMRNDDVEKFRLVIQLVSPIPTDMAISESGAVVRTGDWFFIKEALSQFAGPADPKSFESNTMYFLPSCHPDRQEYFNSWANEGVPLDWSTLSRSVEPATSNLATSDGPSSSQRRSGLTLHPDTILETREGPIRFGDVDRNIDGVVCPLHDDLKGGEFVARSPAGRIFLHCKHCGTIDVETPQSSALVASAPQQPNFDDLLTFDTEYYDASDRSLVQDQLKEICNEILNDKVTAKGNQIDYARNRSHILFMPEGSGKSLLAREMARLGKKIVFACKSWDQAFDKYEEFKSYGNEHGFSVDLFLSRDGKARRRFGIGVARGSSNDPYRIGKIDDDASLARFRDKNPRLSDEIIRICWNFISQDQLDVKDNLPYEFRPDDVESRPLFDRLHSAYFGKNADLLVTTHAQLRTISQREQYIPRDWIIWIDDPDIWDVIDIERYHPKRWPELSDEEVDRRTIDIKGRRYFRRDPNQALGISQRRHTCIYTTTENVTKLAIEKMLSRRKESYVVHDRMNHLCGGNISILGTTKVRRDLDGIIPVLSRVLEKQGFNNVLIANGLATPLNHSNNKGNNKLKNNIILVELSIPHPHEILTCYDALGISPGSDRNEMGRMMTLDRMHQAIGRNSGYRWEGFECVVLADSKYHKYLIENVRYKIDEKNSVVIDHTASMSRNERRTSKSVTEFVAATESLVVGVNQLVEDRRRINAAIRYVLGQIEDPEKLVQYTARLLRSLASHAHKDFWDDSEPGHPENHTEKTYKELGDWILHELLTSSQRDQVLKEFQRQD